MDIIEKLDLQLGYKEQVTLSRDEWDELNEYIDDYAGINSDLQKEIDDLEGVSKQLDQAREILDGIIECIHDDGLVADQKYLVKRLAVAIKFVENLD